MQPTCIIAFKEWAAVCEALATGRQTIILRKGEIHEEFNVRVAAAQGIWLCPTHFHQQAEDLTGDAGRYIERAATDQSPPGQFGSGQRPRSASDLPTGDPDCSCWACVCFLCGHRFSSRNPHRWLAAEAGRRCLSRFQLRVWSPC